MIQTKILVADDDPLLASMYEIKFANVGFKVLVAEDGEQAWDQIKEHKPQIVVTDVMMPKMSGIELLQKMRETRGFMRTPVIVLTNSNNEEDKLLAKKFDAQQYLVKAHFTPAQVLHLVSEHVYA